jgi:hypothetical protein
MEEGREVGSERNSGQAWPLRRLLVEYMLGRCRRRSCRLDTEVQKVVDSFEEGCKTNLEVEVHSRTLHSRLAHGRRTNHSEQVVQIVRVGC